MGKTEKIVVLSVLFAVVVLFVWSLDQDGTAAADRSRAGESGARAGDTAGRIDAPEGELGRGAGGSGDEAPRTAAGGPVIRTRPHPGADPGEGAGPGSFQGAGAEGPLLTAEVGGKAPSRGAETGREDDSERFAMPAAPRAEWDLVTLAGLAATVDPETFTLTARDGETWDSIAERLYGSAEHARALRHANEGTVLAAGEVLLVPAIDRLPRTPVVREIEVLEGEGLWHVAARALGSGARWKELHAANRDRVPNPDMVRAGMLLRVP